MAKKPDSFYYDNLSSCAERAARAACLLDGIMRSYDPEHIEDKLTEMHAIEQEADELRHEMQDALIKAFITPIEREDLDALSSAIDSVVDHIEGVLHRLYFDNVTVMRPDALIMSKRLVEAIDEMQKLIAELPRFKKSQTLHEHVVAINTIEGEADDFYIRAMRTLHTEGADPMTVIAWRDVYLFLELCADSCENVAELISTIIMKNS